MAETGDVGLASEERGVGGRCNEDDLVEQFYRIAKSMIEADLEKEQA